MSYIKQKITVYGTARNLINKVVEFLQNNSLVAFTLKQSIDTSNNEAILVDSNGSELRLTSSDYGSIKVSFGYSESNTYVLVSKGVVMVSNNDAITTKAINLCLIKADTNYTILITGYNKTYTDPDLQVLFFNCTNELQQTRSIYVLQCSSGLMTYYSVTDKESNGVFSLRCSRMPPEDSSCLIETSNGISVTRTSNNMKYDVGAATELHELAGTEQYHNYIVNEKKYLCCIDGICIEYGDRVQYVEPE